MAAAACADAALTRVADLGGRDRAALVGPSAIRPFVATTIAERRFLLVVTATGREADDLTAELTEMVGDAVVQFPSWETLPHERLSPGADTIGRRLEVLRRLARPDDADYGDRLRVVVTTVRSMMQPMAPGLGDIEPLAFRVGAEFDFDRLIEQLVEYAYTRVDMVGRRGEFAVRGGILDIFSPTADHPVRVEFWGDEITEMRAFAVADQRSLPDVDIDLVIAPPCRELLLTESIRARAAQLATDNPADAALAELFDKLAAGIPVEGMEALLPVLVPGKLQLLTEVLPDGAQVMICDPEKIRTRAADLVRTGQEFLEASWTAASIGGAVPLDTSNLRDSDGSRLHIDLGASAYRALSEIEDSASARDLPWWTISPLASGDEDEIVLDVGAAPAPRGSADEVSSTFAMLRAHVSSGGRAVIVVAGHGTAERVLERLREAEVPSAPLAEGAQPEAGVVGVLCGAMASGFVLRDSGLVVISESDLTG
ncbi:MAG: transcription-repair coupling factor, partial [Aldersonia sp.]|nr:transcription-repair coupling factor [Aldersonia sp.]